MIDRRPLRVVHLGKYYPPATGGIESHVQTLARGQATLGADVTVVAVNHRIADGRDVTYRAFARTPSVTETDGRVRVHRVGRIASVARFDVTPGLHALLGRLRRGRPDVWHLHAPNPAMLLALARDAALSPLVVSHHADVVRQRVLRHAMSPLERAVYARADVIVASSPEYAAGSTTLARVARKVRIVPLGVDLAPFEAGSVADAGPARGRGPLWLTVGRLVPYKALDVALRALVDVEGTLVVVGTGPMEAAWRGLARELGVGDRVVFRGSVPFDELVSLYHAATALWFPSDGRGEAFGIVQVEALASGCPVINARIPGSGVPFVSRHEETGLTVPIDDARALAAAAKRLLDDPALRERLSRAARVAARARFDQRVMARRMLDLYACVLDDRGPRWAS